MSVVALPSSAVQTADALAVVRMRGGFRISAGREDGVTRLRDLDERGGWRVRFPSHDAAHLEAVTINTGGGIVGGDHVRCEVDVGGGDLVVASQAAERIYRSLGPLSVIDVAIKVEDGGRLDWTPQETILFSGSKLRRSFQADVASGARLLMVEMVVFGRTASGETLGEGALHDTWRLHRDGRLVFADNLRLEGQLGDLLARPAVAAGAKAAAMFVLIAPDAGERIDAVRAVLADATGDWGASAWDGKLVVRGLGASAAELRAEHMRVLEVLTGRPLPRVWSM